MNDKEGQSVFVVDDDEDLRDALSLLMRAAGLKSKTYASAREFLQRLSPGERGCLLLDMRMPGMTGLELQAELNKRRIRLPIIFLTGYADVPMAVRAMKIGAFDFIQKPIDEHRLVFAVKNALIEEAKETASMAYADHLGNVDQNKLTSLSRREQNVLRLMLEGKRNREIGETLCISIKTVEFHRANIREKLGVSSLPELCRLVYKLK
jgi:FixJ family two-component response regulator